MSQQLPLFSVTESIPQTEPRTPKKRGRAAKASAAPALFEQPVIGSQPSAQKLEEVACATEPPPSTLGEVMRGLLAADTAALRNREMRSALNTLAKVLGRKLDDIPTSPERLSKQLAEAEPALARVGMTRWTKVKSLTRLAIGEAGVEVMPGRASHGLTSSWGALAAQLPTRANRYGLSRVLRYFGREGIEPESVTLHAFARYQQALKTKGLLANAEATYKSTVRQWNSAVGSVKGWPQVVLPTAPDSRRYSLPWHAFQPSFREDVEAFLAHSGDQDVFSSDFAPSVKPSTLRFRKMAIQQVASALIESGFLSVELSSLAVLVHAPNAKRALKQLRDRTGAATPHLANQTQLLCLLAKYWVKSEGDHRLLKQTLSNIRPKKSGMTNKNRNRLRQFELDTNVAALMNLPDRVKQDVLRLDDGGREPALRMMLAVVLQLLLVAPIRFDNYAGMELHRHLVEVRRGKDRIRHIVIPAEETKTNQPLQIALPAGTDALLDLYLRDYRHRLTSADSPFLFPGRGERRRARDAFSNILKKFIRRETGLVMNAHLFRHLAGFLYLREHPEDIETVRQLLGHTTSRTTLRSYAEISSDHAFRRYDQLVQSKQQGLLHPKKKADKR